MIFFLFDDKTEPADIFAEIPSEKDPNAPAAPAAGTTPLPVGESGIIMQQSGLGKKWIILLVIILLLVASGVAAYLFMRAAPEPVPFVPVAENPQPAFQSEPQPQTQPELSPQPEPEPVPAQPALDADSDGDGLSDAREAQLGTNASLVDSDADGLSDREEVEVYMTDPLNPDSDGDTYKDGDEVRSGYDPKGPGKLLQIPPAQ